MQHDSPSEFLNNYLGGIAAGGEGIDLNPTKQSLAEQSLAGLQRTVEVDGFRRLQFWPYHEVD